MIGTSDQSCWLAEACKILLLLLADSITRHVTELKPLMHGLAGRQGGGSAGSRGVPRAGGQLAGRHAWLEGPAGPCCRPPHPGPDPPSPAQSEQSGAAPVPSSAVSPRWVRRGGIMQSGVMHSCTHACVTMGRGNQEEEEEEEAEG